MILFDETLYELKQKSSRKTHLKAALNDLFDQRRELDKNRFSLKCEKMKEQADVDKLKNPSLTGFFYRLTGQFDERLTQEEKEAYEATLRYDTILRDLESLDHKIKTLQNELSSLEQIEKDYTLALKEKKEAIKNSSSQDAEAILILEQKIATLESQEKEIREAIYAGNNALRSANDVLHNLDKAAGWGTWDMIGGGTLSTLQKHDYLSKAQAGVSSLQTELRYFRSELADVNIYSNLNVSVDGFTKFADFFFDNIFVDMDVQNRIRSSIGSVSSVKSQIQTSLQKLNLMLNQNSSQKEQLSLQLEQYLIGNKSE